MTASIPRVRPDDSMNASTLLLKKGCPPLVLTGALTNWPASHWSLVFLADTLGEKLFRCRLTPLQRLHKGPAWEAESLYIECTFQHFSDWCTNQAGEDNPLKLFSPQSFSGYIDYKYMSQVFEEIPDRFADVCWSALGLQDIDGHDSTLWVGSKGASTPCHYDSYGFNLVAQIQGRKQWVLFPPEDSICLYPTRIPYEESSVFSQVDVLKPDLERFPLFQNCRPVVVTLEPGQVLYVPHHWWHHVICTETAISINTWVDVSDDAESRLHEAVARCLASALISHLDQIVNGSALDQWINPTEELMPAATNMDYLRMAFSQVNALQSHNLRTIQNQHKDTAVNKSYEEGLQETILKEKNKKLDQCALSPKDDKPTAKIDHPLHSVKVREVDHLSQSSEDALTDTRIHQLAIALKDCSVHFVETPFTFSEYHCKLATPTALENYVQLETKDYFSKEGPLEVPCKRLKSCSDPGSTNICNKHTDTWSWNETSCDSFVPICNTEQILVKDDQSNLQSENGKFHSSSTISQELTALSDSQEGHSVSDGFTKEPTKMTTAGSSVVVHALKTCGFENYLEAVCRPRGDDEQFNTDRLLTSSAGRDKSVRVQEALLRSTLHPDIIRQIVLKLKDELNDM